MGVEPTLNNSFADCSLTVRADVHKEDCKSSNSNGAPWGTRTLIQSHAQKARAFSYYANGA